MKCIIEPAINVYSREEFIRRISSVKDFADIIQFDVIDGVFAQPGNFNDPAIVKNILSSAKIDLHLMVMDIDKELERWLKISPQRIIIHVEHPGGIEEYFKKLETYNIKKGLAIAPFTSLEKVVSLIDRIDYLLLMSVVPGRNGQQFICETIEKLKIIRSKYSALEIGVDGGVQENNLLSLRDAGANNIVVGSSLFSGITEERYQKFVNIVRQ